MIKNIYNLNMNSSTLGMYSNSFGGSNFGFGMGGFSNNLGMMLNGGFGINNMFTNCNGDINTNLVLGYEFGKIGMGVVGMIIGNCMAGKAEKAAKRESAVTNNETELAKINKKIDDLSAKIIANQSKIDTETELKAGKETAQQTYERLKDKQYTARTTEDRLELKKLDGDAKTKGSIKYYEAQLKEIEQLKADNKKYQDEIKELQEQQRTLENKLESAQITQLTGNKKIKMSNEDYKNLFKDGKLADGAKVTSDAIQKAIKNFSSPTDLAAKKLAAEQFMELWSEYRYNKPSPTEQRCYNLIYEYLEKENENENE